MTNTPIRAGILGVGTIATSPSGFLIGLMEMKEAVTIVSAADPVTERAEAVAAQYGIFAIHHSPFAIHHSPFIIHHLSFAHFQRSNSHDRFWHRWLVV